MSGPGGGRRYALRHGGAGILLGIVLFLVLSGILRRPGLAAVVGVLAAAAWIGLAVYTRRHDPPGP